MPVDRCVCHRVPFRELLAIAEGLGERASVELLGELTGAGTGCGTCRPYIQWMLNTGHTSFPVLPAGTNEPPEGPPA